VKENGFYFIEAMPVYNEKRPEPGTADPAKWTPYRLWAGDRWECEGCGAVIVSGVSRAPLAEHYQPDFAAQVARLNATQLQVNDC
jgi:hypothetical protein